MRRASSQTLPGLPSQFFEPYVFIGNWAQTQASSASEEALATMGASSVTSIDQIFTNIDKNIFFRKACRVSQKMSAATCSGVKMAWGNQNTPF